MIRHGSLFSGIGGFDLAAQWAGWANTFQVEIAPWCQRILAKNFPHVTRHTDIHTFDPTPYRGTIDVLSGGFPCQPYSSAGQRKGKDDPRHLWPQMLRVIQTIQPRWVVGENVRGLVNWSNGLVFHEVQTDLESAGYHVQPYILPAAGVNAPHERQRVWFIAHRQSQQMGTTRQPRQHQGLADAPHPKDIGRQRSRATRRWGNGFEDGGPTHPHPNRQRQQQPERTIGEKRRRPEHLGQKDVANPDCRGLERRENQEAGQIPTYRDNWSEWTTEPPVCRMDDGIPHRVDRIRGLGNAIVPQVAWRIFDTINQYESR